MISASSFMRSKLFWDYCPLFVEHDCHLYGQVWSLSIFRFQPDGEKTVSRRHVIGLQDLEVTFILPAHSQMSTM